MAHTTAEIFSKYYEDPHMVQIVQISGIKFPVCIRGCGATHVTLLPENTNATSLIGQKKNKCPTIMINLRYVGIAHACLITSRNQRNCLNPVRFPSLGCLQLNWLRASQAIGRLRNHAQNIPEQEAQRLVCLKSARNFALEP